MAGSKLVRNSVDKSSTQLITQNLRAMMFCVLTRKETFSAPDHSVRS